MGEGSGGADEVRARGEAGGSPAGARPGQRVSSIMLPGPLQPWRLGQALCPRSPVFQPPRLLCRCHDHFADTAMEARSSHPVPALESAGASWSPAPGPGALLYSQAEERAALGLRSPGSWCADHVFAGSHQSQCPLSEPPRIAWSVHPVTRPGLPTSWPGLAWPSGSLFFVLWCL